MYVYIYIYIYITRLCPLTWKTMAKTTENIRRYTPSSFRGLASETLCGYIIWFT